MHDYMHEEPPWPQLGPVLDTPGRGRDVAVEVDCELDCQTLDLLHLCYAEAGGVQPRSKVVQLSLIEKILASSLAVRLVLQRGACLYAGAQL